MQLLIPTLEEISNFDNVHIGTMIQDLEQKIANQYFVHPVMSNKAYETFKVDGETSKKLLHVTFGYKTKGRITDNKLIYQLFKYMWSEVSKAWEPGSLVMWRRRAEVKEFDHNDLEWFGEGKKLPADWHIQLTIRLGSFKLPKVKVKTEEEPLQYVNV